jgi:hypothetical protein
MTFDEYYRASVHAAITSLEHRLETLGLMRSSEVAGIFDAAVSVPVLFSGSTRFDYDLQSNWHDLSLITQKGQLQYAGLAGSGQLTFDKLGLIAEKGNLHILYKNLESATLITPEMRTIFANYNDTWLSWTQAEAEAGITDPQELRVMAMTKNLAKMDIATIEKYLTTYPIWKQVADLGMSGSLHVYSVELDREKAITLVDTITTDLTGSGLTTEDQSALRTELTNIGITGTLAFDPADASIGQTRLTLSSTGGISVGTISIDNTATGTQMTLRDTASNTELMAVTSAGESRDDITVWISQSGETIGKLVGYIDHTGGKFRELSATVTAGDITGTLRHTQKDDGTFDGAMIAPNVFSITWNGSIADGVLTALKTSGSSPLAGNYTLDLTESGEMLRGPFVFSVGEEEVMRANVGLIARHEQFRLVLDIPQGTGSTDMMHAEFGMTMKRSSFTNEIKAPSPTTPLQKVLDELQKLTTPAFTEETSNLPSSAQ